MKQPTLSDMITCLNREIFIRQGYYPKAVARRKMTEEQADWEIRTMTAAKDLLEAIRRCVG